jgi:hypothetical protein
MLNSPLKEDEVGCNDGGEEFDVDGVVMKASHSSMGSEGRVAEGLEADMMLKERRKDDEDST